MVKETVEEEEEEEEEDESAESEEEEEPEYEGIGRSNLADLGEIDVYEEQERLRASAENDYQKDQKVNLDDLKSGI
jgi:hypothetical protein